MVLWATSIIFCLQVLLRLTDDGLFMWPSPSPHGHNVTCLFLHYKWFSCLLPQYSFCFFILYSFGEFFPWCWHVFLFLLVSGAPYSSFYLDCSSWSTLKMSFQFFSACTVSLGKVRLLTVSSVCRSVIGGVWCVCPVLFYLGLRTAASSSFPRVNDFSDYFFKWVISFLLLVGSHNTETIFSLSLVTELLSCCHF